MRKARGSAKLFLSALAAMVVLAALTVGVGGCGDGNPSNPNPQDSTVTPPGVGLDSRLILGEGYAWVAGAPDDGGIYFADSMAVIFNNDGTMSSMAKFIGITWAVFSTGAWHTDSGILYVIDDEGEIDATPYTVSGNTLTITDPEDGTTQTYTKAPFRLIVPGDGELDPELVKTYWENESVGNWVFDVEEGTGSAVFMSAELASMDDLRFYYWNTSGGNLTLTNMQTGLVENIPYSITGNVLTIDGVPFTKNEETVFMLGKSPKSKLSERIAAPIEKRLNAKVFKIKR